jgi:hypothetical protein
MRIARIRILTIAAGIGLAGTLASPGALAAAGKVLLVSGVAKGAGERTLRKGDEIEVGDVVSTDAGARVQLMMADGARIILQPASSVRIDEFAMPSAVTDPNRASAQSSPGKSVATLLSGRIDASAGAIGAITIHAHGEPVTLTRDKSAFVSLDASGGVIVPPALEDAERPPELPRGGHTRLGLAVNLLAARLPQLPEVSAAIAVPSVSQSQSGFVASTTERSDTLVFNNGGNVQQFNSLLGVGEDAEGATYLSGTAALLDFGRNGSSGIRWGRWFTGAASVSTRDGDQPVNLQNASLHWIAGPIFEARPMLPTSGAIHFTLAGGTSPTDTLGHAGALNAGVFSADFTAQRVNLQLSLDVNGYNWFATGSGPLAADSLRFDGSFGTVLVDGRVTGAGGFSGFLSAGPLTRDQLNGAGLSYWLEASQGALGTVSGVAAFIPGGMYPLAPTLVQRNVAYAAGGLLDSDLASGSGTNNSFDLQTDAAPVDQRPQRMPLEPLRPKSSSAAVPER